MADAGARVTFIAPRSEADRFEIPRENLVRLRPPRELVGGEGRLTRAVSSINRILQGWASLIRARARNRVFVTTIPDPFVFSLPAFMALKLTGARILYIVHDPLPHAWNLPPRLRKVEIAGYRTMYNLADTLVVLTETARKSLHEHFGLADKPIILIEHGHYGFETAPTPVPGNGRLLMFGTLRRNKGILEAILGVVEARARGANATLVIAGAPHGADPAYWDACNAVAAAHPEAVELHIGYVEDAALIELVKGADAFILPYRNFNSDSGVALLAASNGRPVISTRDGSMGLMLDEGLPGVAIEPPAEGPQVADAVQAFLATPAAAWDARAAAYRARILEERSWSRIGQRYVDAAKDLT
jgi:glycosyltransferase involved in cell wall biosynthesis